MLLWQTVMIVTVVLDKLRSFPKRSARCVGVKRRPVPPLTNYGLPATPSLTFGNETPVDRSDGVGFVLDLMLLHNLTS